MNICKGDRGGMVTNKLNNSPWIAAVAVMVLLGACLLSGCLLSTPVKVGWDSAVTPGYTSTLSQWFDGHAELALEGEVILTAGALAVSVFSPDGEIAFSHEFIVGSEKVVDERFTPAVGEWRMIAESHDGVGDLALHLSQRR